MNEGGTSDGPDRQDSDHAGMSGPSLRAAELVERLWQDVARRQAAQPPVAVPELGPTSRMIHDPDLVHLNSHRDLDLTNLVAHLVPLLTALAERRDELVAEVRLLRQAIVAQSERLAERQDLLHRLLEDRLDVLQRGLREPG